jgi:hypothetical protein
VLTAHETNDTVSWKQVEMDLLLEGISREDFQRHRERIRKLLDWVVANECDLASLLEVILDDFVSCVASKVTTNPSQLSIDTLPRPIRSLIDEIFGPSSSPPNDPADHIVLIDQVQLSSWSAPQRLKYHSTTVEELFGPIAFHTHFEKAFNEAPPRLDINPDDVWRSLDVEIDQAAKTKPVNRMSVGSDLQIKVHAVVLMGSSGLILRGGTGTELVQNRRELQFA